MSLDKRREIIRAIEQQRGSRVVTYVTGDRPAGGPALDLSLQIEPTVVPWIHKALRSVGRCHRIDLFIYTRGGAVDVVWPVISLLREYGERVAVLVPYRAHSAGTLFALGGDEIVMTEASELTSVDPTTGGAFNPRDDLNTARRKGISVEDVTAYFQFVREGKGVALQEPQQILSALTQLTSQVHPLALGHVQRVHTQIRMLAERLLETGAVPEGRKPVAEIVETLTEKLYSHTHAVNRRDAADLLGGGVVFAQAEEEDLLFALLGEYQADMQLLEPFNLWREMDGAQQVRRTYTRGFVETGTFSAAFQSELNLTVFSQKADGIYSQKTQQTFSDIDSAAPGLPNLVKGLPAKFQSDVYFEGWRQVEEEQDV